MARTPLIAGNWKMNLDHLQAVAFVQKLHWTLKDAAHDDASVEVAVPLRTRTSLGLKIRQPSKAATVSKPPASSRSQPLHSAPPRSISANPPAQIAVATRMEPGRTSLRRSQVRQPNTCPNTTANSTMLNRVAKAAPMAPQRGTTTRSNPKFITAAVRVAPPTSRERSIASSARLTTVTVKNANGMKAIHGSKTEASRNAGPLTIP